MFRTISWSLALGEQSSQSPNKIYVRLASIKHPPIFRNPKTMAAIWSPFLNFADRRVCKKPLVSGMIEKTFRENRTQRSSVAVSLPFLNKFVLLFNYVMLRTHVEMTTGSGLIKPLLIFIDVKAIERDLT